jgi:DNA-binding NarL/FixJ family response regulator
MMQREEPDSEQELNNNKAPSYQNACLVVMIDTRACMIDAIALSIKNALGSRVLVVERTEDLTSAAFDLESDSNTLFVYCDGAINDQTKVDQDIRELRKAFKDSKLVLLTDRLERLSMDTFHEHSLDGIIPSSYNTDQLVACVFAILSGVQYLPPILLQQKISNQKGSKARGKSNKKLTPRQQQIMQYIAIGKSNKYIAAELSLCESTVKVHVHEVMKRLGATSRTHASYILANDTGMD